jgi:SNF2 family DNA or RNA helicase
MTFRLEIGLDSAGGQVTFTAKSLPGEVRPSEFNQWILTSLERPEFLSRESFSISIFDFLNSLRSLAQIREAAGGFEVLINDDRVSTLINDFRDSSDLLSEYASDPMARISEHSLRAALRDMAFKRTDELSSDQMRDISRMAFLSHAANFSVPGAGKTTALLAVHTFELSAGRVDSLLVVAPRNALGSWEIEVEKCLTNVEVTRLTGGRERVQRLLATYPRIATVSYQQLRTCVDVIALHLLRHKVHLVLDEAHRAKAGLKSQQGQSALLLSPLARRRDILTGTPMPQGISDIQSQIAFLWPGQRIFDESRELLEQVSAAKQSIKPLYVRTRKSELGLPPIRFSYHSIEMDSWQKSIHSLLARKLVSQLIAFSSEDEQQLRKLGRQIMKNILFCADPEVFGRSLDSNPEYREVQKSLSDVMSLDTSKLVYLDTLVETILSQPGEKLVLWSSFTAVIEKLTNRYANHGASFIHGAVQTSEEAEEGSREWVIQEFHSNPKNRILVANPAACGEGISLHHAAHHAVYFDRSFNAAHYLQSIDRIHRRGLPEGVETRVHVLFLKNTIEEVIRDRLSQKVKALEVLLDDPDLVTMVYDPEDIENLQIDESGLDRDDLSQIVKCLAKATT